MTDLFRDSDLELMMPEAIYPDDIAEEFDEDTVDAMLDKGWCEAMIDAMEDAE